MATCRSDDEESLSGTESEDNDESDFSTGNSDDETDCHSKAKEPCKYYNRGRCQDGGSCPYWHVCKYALTGSCRYGAKCKLTHPGGGGGRRSSRDTRPSAASSDPKLTDGRHYQWQLHDGEQWMDVENDHVIEAQYSLPHTKGIKIYNTPYGAVSVDFNRMKVHGKSLGVRRLDDGNTVWIWYCTLRGKWKKFAEKDSKGNPSPAKSSDIEQKFQSNPSSSFTFSIGSDTFEIKFRDMRQVGQKKKRKVTRRPVYRQQAAATGVFNASQAAQNLRLDSKAQWQFEGDSGAWHEFKRRQRGTPTECSTTSEDIERRYQQNNNASMDFKVKGHSYKLDFAAMTQTNLKTRRSRKIRRVLV